MPTSSPAGHAVRRTAAKSGRVSQAFGRSAPSQPKGVRSSVASPEPPIDEVGDEERCGHGDREA